MNVPVCPGCKLPMKKDELWGSNGFNCRDGCGNWYWTAPKDDKGPQDSDSTESPSDSGSRIGSTPAPKEGTHETSEIKRRD